MSDIASTTTAESVETSATPEEDDGTDRIQTIDHEVVSLSGGDGRSGLLSHGQEGLEILSLQTETLSTNAATEDMDMDNMSAAADTEDIELDQIAVVGAAEPAIEEVSDRLVSDLAPMDGGFGAWGYLMGAFVIETAVWSFPTSYGVFLPILLSEEPYKSQANASTLLPLIGTLSSGLIYCSGPVVYPLLARYPRQRRPCMWIGALICWASLLVASYTTEVSQLVALQGVSYGVGGALLYAPCMSYLSEWFQARIGTANGIIFAGTAAGGLVLPLILPHLLQAYGVAKSLRILSIAMAIVLLPVLFFIRGRLPDPRVAGTGARRRAPTGWLFKNKTLWFLMAANTIQALAYFVPLLWLPSYASALNLSDADGSLAIMLINGVSVVSRIGLGVLADHFSPWALAFASLISVSLITFILWGIFSTSLGALLVFCVAYGAMAGGWTSLWTGFMRPVTHNDPTLSTTLMGFLLLSRGLGNVLSAPISTALLGPDSHTRGKTGFQVGGSRFEALIIYVGVLFSAAAIMIGTGWALEGWLQPTEVEDERRSR